MTIFLRVLFFLIFIASTASAVEIDSQEPPLIKLTFPLDSNTEEDGPHEVIIFVLYKSGIGYSDRQIWNAYGSSSTGSTRDRYTFWLEPSLIEAVVSAAQSYPVTKDVPPRNQQLIIEGIAISNKVVSSWLHSEQSPLKLLSLLDRRIRDDLHRHFRHVQEGQNR